MATLRTGICLAKQECGCRGAMGRRLKIMLELRDMSFIVSSRVGKLDGVVTQPPTTKCTGDHVLQGD